MQQTQPKESGSSRGIALELRDLSKRYGSVTALDRLSFSVGEGQMFGFVGPNGAGKTTAMRIALGVLEPDSGEVRWKGERTNASARRRFGYMPEERGLYPKMRVGRQLAYLAKLHGLSSGESQEAAKKWLQRLGVAERSSDKVEALSLGNQQRVQLAAALAHEPDLLVLDEPFSGLDPVGVDALSEVLIERTEMGVPVIFSSHQLELVERLCESVAIIRDGSLVAQGTVEQLRSRDGKRLLSISLKPEDGADEPRSGHLGRVAETLPGVEVIEIGVQETGTNAAEGNGSGAVGEEGLLVSLAEEADEQKVLDEARKIGRVTHFAFERPTLSKIFREAIDQ